VDYRAGERRAPSTKAQPATELKMLWWSEFANYDHTKNAVFVALFWNSHWNSFVSFFRFFPKFARA
jgi:hypothetical protein